MIKQVNLSHMCLININIVHSSKFIDLSRSAALLSLSLMSEGMQVPVPISGGVDRSVTTVPLKYKCFTRIFSSSVPSQIFYADNFFCWASSVEQLWECVSFVRECYVR